METITFLIDLVLHLDKHLGQLIQTYGLFTYFILFMIIFCETGLVVTPFLPGDSLLFAAGSFAALGVLDPWILFLLLSLAAIVGDSLNYAIGNKLGARILDRGLIKKEHLERTHQFYEKYGGKTIVIARFVPIVRTLAPFVAGLGSMTYKRFLFFNVSGGLLWISSLTAAGYFFGQMPLVKNNFSLVIVAIIILSILPGVIEVIRQRAQAKRQG
ncbi:MAG: DedA family protein [Desulfarculus sp.]|nr:DedA family protein [Desulfarculus sp.]